MELDVRTLVGAMEADDVEAATAMIQSFLAVVAAAASALETLRGARDRDGTPLVSLAVRLNQPSVLDALLDCGCACQEEELTGGEESDGEDVGDIYRGCSPLCEALKLSNDDCARVLVAHGASVDAPSRADGSDQTPIHIGALYGSKGSFFREEALATALGVDPLDVANYTPLYLTVVYSAIDTARLLVAAGADPRGRVMDDATLLHVTATYTMTQVAVWLLDDCVVDADARDAFGHTPLLEATIVSQHRLRRSDRTIQ